MNTTENNKLIAEFLEFNLTTDGIQILYYNKQNSLKALPKFHTDWNWLIPVVEKIESLNFVVQIHLNSCFIKEQEHFINSKAIWRGKNHANTKIEAVYNACIEFIKWYNEQKN